MLSARGETGDIEQAAELLQRAGEIASELGLDRIVERAERARKDLGELEPAQVAEALAKRPSEAVSPAQAELCREGDVWAFHFDGRAIRVRDSRGIRSLAVLLDNPGVEIHSLELAALGADPETRGRANVPPDGTASGADGAGPVLDTAAKAAYRRRLEELREEAEQAESFNDPERAAKAKDEIDVLTQALASAVGFGGRDRKSASNAERARVAVTKAIRATLKRINELDTDLGQELGATIRTGTFCAYEPDRRQPVTWRVEGE
jgi:hypothetical protein